MCKGTENFKIDRSVTIEIQIADGVTMYSLSSFKRLIGEMITALTIVGDKNTVTTPSGKTVVESDTYAGAVITLVDMDGTIIIEKLPLIVFAKEFNLQEIFAREIDFDKSTIQIASSVATAQDGKVMVLPVFYTKKCDWDVRKSCMTCSINK